MAKTTVAFRIGASEPALLDELAQRGEKRGLIARRDLERYYGLLKEALARLSFTESERDLLASLPVDQIGDHRLLWAAASNAVRELTAPRVEDPNAFIRRLRDLAPLESCALVDALERCHQRPGALVEPLRMSA